MEQINVKRRWNGWLLVLVTLLALMLLGIAAAQQIAAQGPETPDEGETAVSQPADVATGDEVVVHTELLIGESFVPRDAVETALETAVANGSITQEAADGILADIETAVPEASVLSFEALEADITAPFFFEHEPLGHGLLFALFEQAKADGILTEEEAQAILEDFAELGGDSVSITFDEGAVEMTLSGADETLSEALAAALDNAVANGVLTAEEAETLKQRAEFDEIPFLAPMELHVSPDFSFEEIIPGFNEEGEMVVNGFRFEGGLLEFAEGLDAVAVESYLLTDSELNSQARLEANLEEAVAEGRITAEEAEAIREAVAPLFGEE